MDLIGSEFILYFYNNIDILLVIFVRIIAFITVLPVFTTATIPLQAKLSFSLFFAYIIFSAGKVTDVYYFNSLIGYAMILIQELLVGIIMAFNVYTVFAIINFAGQLMDFSVGFSMVSVFDPMSQIQVPITGNLYYFVISILFIQSGGINTFIAGLFYSYDAIPVGSSIIIGNGELMQVLMDMMVKYFIFGVQIALPLVGTILIIDVVLGILVKAVPQMNVFVVGMPIKLLAGLVLLYTITPILFTIYEIIFEYAISVFTDVVRSLSL
jgi:flagellar biosynthesis protein FliR